MRVLAIFCAAFAAGVALSQYLLSAQWALILCGVFAAAADHLEEPELLELKRAYEKQAARRFPAMPQLRDREV